MLLRDSSRQEGNQVRYLARRSNGARAWLNPMFSRAIRLGMRLVVFVVSLSRWRRRRAGRAEFGGQVRPQWIATRPTALARSRSRACNRHAAFPASGATMETELRASAHG